MRKGLRIAGAVFIALGLLDLLVIKIGLWFFCFIIALFLFWGSIVRWRKSEDGPKRDPEEKLPEWRYDKYDAKLLAPDEDEWIGDYAAGMGLWSSNRDWGLLHEMHANEVWRFRAKDHADAEKRLARMFATNQPDPEAVLPADAWLCPLFRHNGHKRICSMNALKVGNDWYMPAVAAREDRMFGVEEDQRCIRKEGMRGLDFAKRCAGCQGAGTTGGDNVCPQCFGNQYAAWCSASPADMVLIQMVTGAADERFRAFVAAHRDEFNEYMRHVMLAGCYLADAGERQVYARDLNKDFRAAIAGNPDAELANIRAMKAAYEQVMLAPDGDSGKTLAETAETRGIWFQPMEGPFVEVTDGLKLTVRDFHWFKDNNTGEPRVSIIGSDDDARELYQLFAAGMDQDAQGNDVPWELHPNGEPCEDGVLRKVILMDRKSSEVKYDDLDEPYHPHSGPAAHARGYAPDKAGRPIVALRYPNVVGYGDPEHYQ